MSMYEHAGKRRFVGCVLSILFTMMICAGAVLNAHASSVDLKDGTYEIAVDLEGGTGKATITSPCTLEVKDGKAFAQIEWSSNHYDYMIVDGEKYLPVNEDGNSTFSIPVSVFDEAMSVTADTTAMSVPHEIDYTLTFHSDEITSTSSGNGNMIYAYLVIAVIIIVLCIVIYKKRRKGNAR